MHARWNATYPETLPSMQGTGFKWCIYFWKSQKCLLYHDSVFANFSSLGFPLKTIRTLDAWNFFNSWSSYHSQVYNLVYIFTHHQKNNFPNVFIPSLKWEPHRNLQSTVFKYDNNIFTPYLRLFSVYRQQFLWILKREDNK